MSLSIVDLMTQSNNKQRAAGTILLHEADSQLLPVLRSAIEQCGFFSSLNNVYWSKTMPDGTKRDLVIHCYNDTSLIPLSMIAKKSRNIIIVTRDGNNTMKSPALIEAVNKRPSKDNSSANIKYLFDEPIGSFGALPCEMMFSVAQRNEEDLSQQQLNAVEAVQQAKLYLRTKYFLIASAHHQHQLTLILDQIVQHFPAYFEKRIIMYRYRKDTPADAPCVTEPLKQIGLEPIILFKATNDHWMCYYLYVDQVLHTLLPKFGQLFYPLLPWLVDVHLPCWKFTETLLNHPNNAHIVEDIRHVMRWMIYIKCLGGHPDNCVFHELDHKLHMIE